jgi:hypothetical protein
MISRQTAFVKICQNTVSCYKKTCTDQSLLNKGIFCNVICLCTLFCFERIFFLAGLVWPLGLLSSLSVHLHSSSLKLQGRMEATCTSSVLYCWTITVNYLSFFTTLRFLIHTCVSFVRNCWCWLIISRWTLFIVNILSNVFSGSSGFLHQ